MADEIDTRTACDPLPTGELERSGEVPSPTRRPDEESLIYNNWYIASTTSQLGAKPFASRVFENDLVLFRDEDGKPCALRDRCCHRATRLSLGRCDGGGLRCCYHGWRFAGDGRCIEVPSRNAKRKKTPNFRVPAFPCVEQDGYVWVWMGDREPGTQLPHRIPHYDENCWYQMSAPQGYHWVKGIENNLDVCHPSWAHPWTHPQWFRVKLRGLRESFAMTTFDSAGGYLVTGQTEEACRDAVGRWEERFELPNRIVITPPTFNRRIPGIAASMTIILHFVPTGPSTCRVEMMINKVWKLGRKHARWKKLLPVLLQDQAILESSQPWYDKDGSAFERSTEADYPMMLVRRVVAAAAAGEDPKTIDSPRTQLIRLTT